MIDAGGLSNEWSLGTSVIFLLEERLIFPNYTYMRNLFPSGSYEK